MKNLPNLPETGAFWRVTLEGKHDPRDSQLSNGERRALEICQKLGMMPFQYYCRSIFSENNNIVLIDAFQYAILPDSERDIVIEYRRDVGDVHLEAVEDIPFAEVPEAPWMNTNEEDARIGLAREKEIFAVPGSHPLELIASSIPIH